GDEASSDRGEPAPPGQPYSLLTIPYSLKKGRQGRMPRRPASTALGRPAPFTRSHLAPTCPPCRLPLSLQRRGQSHEGKEFGAIPEGVRATCGGGNLHDPVISVAGDGVRAAQLLAEGGDGDREAQVLARL